jgi:type II secretory pathway component PulK
MGVGMNLRTASVAIKLTVITALTLATILALLFIKDALTNSARTEARLSTNQADAALKSGQDAAVTVGTQAAREDTRTRATNAATKEVSDAQDTAAAHDAGARWLCDDHNICNP